MEEAAEALDLMNREYNLQHLDIKPQNLFLVHNHLKIADFGLVKDLHGMTATVTSGITPLYAAPELFEGKVTCWCDQYSLAIVYQELLTGVRPFRGKNPQQLLMQHLRGTPDLSPLPEGDREIIGRALSKTPAGRFGCCSDLIQALRGAPAARVPAATDNSRRTQEIPCIRDLPSLKSSDPGEPSVPRAARPTSSTLEPPAGRPTQPDIDLYGPGASARAGEPPRSDTKSNLRGKTVQVDPSPRPTYQDVPCPRCSAVLIDPGPLQWCAVCGHGTGLEPEPLRTTQSPRANSLPVSPWLLVVAAALAGVVIALLLITYGVGR
jgi:serine/threonine protein kinase